MGYDVKQKIDTNAKIAVLMGGPSSEAEISRRSGKNVFKALQNLGYKNAELIEVDENISAFRECSKLWAYHTQAAVLWPVLYV